MTGRTRAGSGPGPPAEPATWPLSWTQLGILFDSEYLGAGTLYKVPYVVRWTGRLDVDGLAVALRTVTSRHAALRVAMRRVDGGWRQWPDPDATIDLERAGPADPIAVSAALAEFVERPFDLTSAPLARALLLQEDADHHVFALVLHHLISDRWSVRLLLDELAAAYRGRLPSTDDDAAFLRYCASERADVARDRLDAGRAYWQRVLDGAPTVTQLAIQRQAARDFVTRRHRVCRRWAAGLSSLATATRTTVPTVLATAFLGLLADLSTTGEAVMGVPTARRDRAGTDRVLGVLVNTVPTRLRVTPDRTHRAAIAALHTQLVDAREHQEHPFPRLVRDGGFSRDSAAHPLFQHVFDWSEGHPRCELPGCRSEVMPVPAHHSPFDLALLATHDGDDVELELEYAVRLFGDDDVEVLVAGLDAHVAAMVSEPDRPASTVAVARPSLVAARPARTGAVLTRFHRRARAAPEAAAIVDGGTTTSYGDLAHRVDAAAALLRSYGARPGTVVALELDAGTDFVVAVLATLQAGAAYLPLDTADPPARRARLLDTVAPVAVVTSGGGRRDDGRFVLDVAAPPAAAVPSSPADPPPTDAAYVIATSGSTGRPRPVVVTHTALENHVAWTVERFELGPADRMLQFCAVGYDAAVEEILPTLCAGATLVVRTPDMAVSAERFVSGCAEHGVTVVDLPTGFWAQLGHELARAGTALPDTVRLVVVGGEPATAAAVNAWSQTGPPAGRRLLNTYGPTEATVVALDCEITPGQVDPPIGTPVSGVSAYVLDRALRPVPRGVVGTLYLGGVGVAAGYLGDPSGTAARFLPDPFTPVPGTRMVNTGDLVRLDSTGLLHFVGRRDRMLKVRGHRAEPGEVEAVLAAHPVVADVAVIDVGDGARSEVVAVVATGDGGGPGADDIVTSLRGQAATQLPAHLWPARYVAVPALPLTARGKLDRAAIERVARAPTAATGPHSAAEARLAAVLAEVLDHREVGPLDDFFALGGHSLAALRVVEALRSQGYGLDVGTLLSLRTVRAVAMHLTAAPATARPAPPAPRAPRLTDTQFGIWVEDQLVEGPSAYTIVSAFDLRGALDAARLEAAFRHVLAETPVLHAVVEERDGELVHATRPATAFRLPIEPIDPVQLDHAGLARLTRRAASVPFDLAADLPVRATLFRAAADHHLLVLCLHHVAADRETEGVLLDACAAAYAGRPPAPAASVPTAPPTNPNWWLRHMSGATLDVPLPLDRVVPEVRRAECHVARVRLDLPPSVLARTATAHGATPFMTFAAAATSWLGRLVGRRDVVVGVALSQRGHRDADVPGPLIDVVPFRATGTPAETFGAAVRRCRAATLDVLAHRPAPVRELMRRMRAGRAGPMYRVLLDHDDGGRSPSRSFGSATVVPRDVPVFTSRADLEISLRHTPEGDTVELRGRADVLERATVSSWASSLTHYLAGAVTAPDTPTDDVSLVPAPPARVPRGAPPDAASPTPLDRVLRSCRDRPSAVAISVAGRNVTYAVLRRRIEEAAGRLRHLDTDAAVGVLVERGPSLVVAILATWHAGRTAVLLDPASPPARLTAQLSRTGVRALFLHAATAALARHLDVAQLVDLDERDGGAPPAAVDQPVPPAEPAYVCFTSGTTGSPKAVAGTGRGLARLLEWSAGAIPLGQDDVFLHIASPGFDIALWEMLHPLACGSRLLVLPPDRSADAEHIAGLVTQHGVTATHLVPSLLHAVLKELRPDQARSLRDVVCGGERLSPALAAAATRRLGVRLHHTYGPTEATIFVEHCPIDHVRQDRLALPLGSPVDGTRVEVLGPRGELLPQGAVGEICLAGDALAFGYLGDGAATAHRFVPHPSGVPGERLFRTGDLGRATAAESIECLGRIDRQIKVGGVRVEPAEVEAHLLTHTRVRDVAVVPFTGPDERVRLAAFVVGTGLPSRPGAELRPHLEQRLPRAAVPSVFVALERLPRTPNGKIDYAALPLPPDEPPSTGTTTPRNRVERALLDAWQAALGRTDIGVHDDFFDVGGDSISAMRIVAAAGRVGVVVGLADVLRAPTVASLARRARGGPPQPSTRASRGDVLPPVPNQIAVLTADPPAVDGFTQAVLLDVDPTVTPETMRRALLAVVGHHTALRQRFSTVDGVVATSVAPPDDQDRLVGFTAVPTDQVDALRAAADSGVDVGRGPLVVAAHAHGSGEPDGHLRVLVAVHHLAVDAVSCEILLDDLSAALRDPGERLPVPPCPVERWATWVERHPPSPGDEARWLSQLDPPGTGDGPDRMPRGATVRATDVLPAATTDRLVRRAHALGATLADAVLAAAVLVYARRTGRMTAALLETHGRSHPDLDLSHTVGWVAAAFPVRPQLPAGASMDEALGATIRALNALPADRHGYRALRNRSGGALAARPEPRLGVNHLGRLPGRDHGPLRLADDKPQRVDARWRPAGDEDVTVESVVAPDGSLHLDVEGDGARVAVDLVRWLAEQIWRELALFADGSGPLRRVAALTPAQAGMLSRALTASDRSDYHTQVLFELRGRVDAEALRGAWADVAANADAFRTGFVWADVAEPRQFVEPDVPQIWIRHDIHPDDLEREWDRLLAADRARPFDLSVPPLSRLTHVVAGPVERLVWSHHHAVFDGWSLPIVQSLVGQAYRRRRDAGPPEPALPSHLAFADWLRAQDVDAARRFFAEQLAGLEAPSLLHGGGSGGANRSVATTLGRARTRTLHVLAGRAGTTPTVVLLSAWAMVVRERTGLDDLVLGLVMSLRPPDVPGVDRMVGACLNTVPIRVQVTDDISFATVVKSLASAVVATYPHAHAPLARTVADAGLGGPLFDAIVVYENYPGDRTGEPLGDDGHLVVLGSHESTEFPWTLIALPDDELRLELHHHGSDLDHRRAAALLDRLHELLTMLTEPT